MLSSITPLGQRGRTGSWRVAVIFFWFGTVTSAIIFYSLLGLFGEAVGLQEFTWAAPAAVAVAMVFDIMGWPVPSPQRQVNEDWLGRYRDWVFGFGFGLQLGPGLLTYVMVWAVWSLVISAIFVGLPGASMIGLMFAVGRSVMLVRTRSIHSQRTLARSMEGFVRLERVVIKSTYIVYGVVILLGVWVAI